MIDRQRLAATSDLVDRRKQAAEKRASAQQIRAIASSLSFIKDKELFRRHADDLEQEAGRLETP